MAVASPCCHGYAEPEKKTDFMWKLQSIPLKWVQYTSLACMFCFPNEVPAEFHPLPFRKLSVHMHVNMTKFEIISKLINSECV